MCIVEEGSKDSEVTSSESLASSMNIIFMNIIFLCHGCITSTVSEKLSSSSWLEILDYPPARAAKNHGERSEK